MDQNPAKDLVSIAVEPPKVDPESRSDAVPIAQSETLPPPVPDPSQYIPPANPQAPAPMFTSSTETRGFEKKPDGIQQPERGLEQRVKTLEGIVQVIRGTMQLPDPVQAVFVAKVTDVDSAGLIQWQEQCFSNGAYTNFTGGRSCSDFGDFAGMPLMSSSAPPIADDYVVMWHVLDPYTRKYRFIYLTTSGASSRSGIVDSAHSVTAYYYVKRYTANSATTSTPGDLPADPDAIFINLDELGGMTNTGHDVLATPNTDAYFATWHGEFAGIDEEEGLPIYRGTVEFAGCESDDPDDITAISGGSW